LDGLAVWVGCLVERCVCNNGSSSTSSKGRKQIKQDIKNTKKRVLIPRKNEHPPQIAHTVVERWDGNRTGSSLLLRGQTIEEMVAVVVVVVVARRLHAWVQ